MRQDTKNLPFDQKPITGLSEACSQFQSYDVSEFRRESADTKIYTPIPTRTFWKKATFTLCRNEKGSSRPTNPPPQTTSSWITPEQPDQLGLVLQLHRQPSTKFQPQQLFVSKLLLAFLRHSCFATIMSSCLATSLTLRFLWPFLGLHVFTFSRNQ